MKNILFILGVLMLCSSIALSQDLKVIISIDQAQVRSEENIAARAQHRVLKANIVDGSGDYSYAWGSTNPYVIIGEKSSSQIRAALNEEDITYRVFVKDNKTGKIGYNTINFKKILAGKDPLNVIVYPNPSSESLTINLDDTDSQKVPVRVELFGEKSTFPVKSIPKEQLAAKKYEISTIGLPQGVYYVHVQYANDAKAKQVRVMINH